MLSATPVAAAHGGGGGGDRLLLHQHHHHSRRGGAHPPPPAPAPPTPMVAAGAAAALPCSFEDPSRKVRKPYTITKSRESWSEVEHDKFLEALHLFDRDWKKIEAFVGSKTVIQIRSHAQKYFLKVQKNGTSEHVPPPRPKRKAAHPYPQKAPKNAAILTQAVAPLPASSLVLEPCYTVSSDSSTIVRNSTSNATLSSSVNGSVQPFGAAQMTKGPSEAITANNCCSRTESPTEMWLTSETTEKENQVPFLRVMPDFSQVYSFLAGVFDPNTSGHLEKLKEMDPIDVETVQFLDSDTRALLEVFLPNKSGLRNCSSASLLWELSRRKQGAIRGKELATIATTWWIVWLERNRRIFQKTKRTASLLASEIRSLRNTWDLFC